MVDAAKELIETHFSELRWECPNFRLAFREKEAVATGLLEFCVADDEERVVHRYHVSMCISENYPRDLPSVIEFDGKVPRNFHTNPTGELCLGVVSDLWLCLDGKLTLSRFVKRCVIPFFISLQQKQQMGTMTQGERSHGDKGIAEFFEDYFAYKAPEKLQRILGAILHDLLNPMASCPCGCGKIYEECCKTKVDLLLGCCPHDVIHEDIRRFFYFKINGKTALEHFIATHVFYGSVGMAMLAEMPRPCSRSPTEWKKLLEKPNQRTKRTPDGEAKTERMRFAVC